MYACQNVKTMYAGCSKFTSSKCFSATAYGNCTAKGMETMENPGSTIIKMLSRINQKDERKRRNNKGKIL